MYQNIKRLCGSETNETMSEKSHALHIQSIFDFTGNDGK